MRYVFIWMYWRAILRVLVGPVGGFFLYSVLVAQPHGFEFFWPTLIASYLFVGGVFKIVQDRPAGGVLMLLLYTAMTAVTLSLPWSVWSGDPKTYLINIVVAFAPFVWVVWGFLKHSNLLWPLPVAAGAVGLLFGALRVLPGIIWDGITGVIEWVHDIFESKRERRAVAAAPSDVVEVPVPEL